MSTESIPVDLPHLYVLVVGGDRYKLRQPLAEPHGYISVHVDSKWLVAFLQATDGEVLQSADIFTIVHPPHLAYTQTAHWDKTWDREKRKSSTKTKLFVHYSLNNISAT